MQRLSAHGAAAGLTSPPQRTLRTTLPATAIVAPTLISCPPEADVTSVMPMASIASSEALSRIVMMLPEITISPALLRSIFDREERRVSDQVEQHQYQQRCQRNKNLIPDRSFQKSKELVPACFFKRFHEPFHLLRSFPLSWTGSGRSR